MVHVRLAGDRVHLIATATSNLKLEVIFFLFFIQFYLFWNLSVFVALPCVICQSFQSVFLMWTISGLHILRSEKQLEL